MGQGLQGSRVETTPERIETFLRVLTDVGLIGDGCLASGLSRTWIFELRRMSPCFAEQCEEAIKNAKGHGLIVESLRRGAMGLDEEVVTNQGLVVMVWYDPDGRVFGNGLPRRYYDEDNTENSELAESEGWRYGPLIRHSRDTKAATFLLAAMDPERYGRTRMELTGKNGGPLETRSVLVVPDPSQVTEWGTGEVIDEEDPDREPED